MRRGVGVEENGISSGDHTDDVAGEGGNGVGDGEDGSDDAEGGVFLEHDACVTGLGIRAQPFHTGDEVHDGEFGELVVEAADFGFLEFEFSPFVDVGGADAFDDLDGFGAAGDAQLLELKERIVCGLGGGHQHNRRLRICLWWSRRNCIHSHSPWRPWLRERWEKRMERVFVRGWRERFRRFRGRLVDRERAWFCLS